MDQKKDHSNLLPGLQNNSAFTVTVCSQIIYCCKNLFTFAKIWTASMCGTWDSNSGYADCQGSDKGNANFVSKRSQSEYEDL
jgi:hypothetical protein